MILDKKVIALIPARGGSKRLPRKNMLPLNGKPLIEWTSDAAKNSKYIDLIVVTSDSDEVLQFSKGLNVASLKRPDFLASDTASSIDVALHAL